MSCNCHGSQPQQLDGFTEDGEAAMSASPGYFLWWYSAKSILLVGVAAALAYQLGKNSRPARSMSGYRKRRRK